uniref:Uncharacterized protein n=1 Tax=Leersia perrieri TaxID=77586 RepID=A0A0D9XYZ3_9ORYZ
MLSRSWGVCFPSPRFAPRTSSLHLFQQFFRMCRAGSLEAVGYVTIQLCNDRVVDTPFIEIHPRSSWEN